MIGEKRFNRYRWIIFTSIIALHVSFLLRQAHAQPVPPLAPGAYGMQTKSDPSKAIVFAVLLSAFFLVGMLSVYLRNCSGPDPSSGGVHRRRAADSSRRNGLEDAVLESFPVFAYSSVKDRKIGSGALQCAVCLSEFEEKEILRLIPKCNHVFHADCIDAWLYSHANCPVCRAKLAPESEKLGDDEPPVTDSIAVESNNPNNSEETGRVRDHIAIDIDGDRTGDSEAIDAAMKREKRRRSGIGGKFPRSNSTGHSLGQLRETTERYTLRLPEDVRKRIMAASGRRLKRTRSYDGCASAAEDGSTRRGRRIGGEGSGGRGIGYGVGSGERYERVNWRDRCGLSVPKMCAVRSRNDNGEVIVWVQADGPLK
ncbi:PREDICTED: RING-H2 finger protein ATL32 [Tarenaya hassleriana]|uniref:RING-H2 finger protein ATL32 n=1 Tax=Tarenaya hassleriana TaxID=28532 RepID=UPI00053C3845|nr:PREDICTED: RING-H2 finger protein ATL32 [Tarenaya hassleriana]